MGFFSTNCCSKQAAIKNLSLSPDVAVELFAEEMARCNGEVLWKSIPANYRDEICVIFKILGNNVDAKLYNESFALFGRLADVAIKQKKFILNTSFAGQLSAEKIASMNIVWPSIIGILRTISCSEIAFANNLQFFDGDSFFNTTISDIIEYAQNIASATGQNSLLEYKVINLVNISGNKCILKLRLSDGAVKNVEFTNIEGSWIPSDWVIRFPAYLRQVKENLESSSTDEITKQHDQFSRILVILDDLLSQLESADTQKDFDRGLTNSMVSIIGLITMIRGTSD